jgi:hypothetical protein
VPEFSRVAVPKDGARVFQGSGAQGWCPRTVPEFYWVAPRTVPEFSWVAPRTVPEFSWVAVGMVKKSMETMAPM